MGTSGRRGPNWDHVYLAVNDLPAVFERAKKTGGVSTDVGDGGAKMGEIARRPWGEVSFYMRDPFGNPLCFVDSSTLFTRPPS
jgi:uncharacterized glyoxalase superfamily protein PhnB